MGHLKFNMKIRKLFFRAIDVKIVLKLMGKRIFQSVCNA